MGMAAVSLIQTLEQAPHALLQPSPDVALSAISLAKELLDPLAQDIARLQSTRRDENRRKRKRGEDGPQENVLQLRTVYTQGLAVKQIWEQTRRVLDAACAEVERVIPQQSPEDLDSVDNDQTNDEHDGTDDPEVDGFGDEDVEVSDDDADSLESEEEDDEDNDMLAEDDMDYDQPSEEDLAAADHVELEDDMSDVDHGRDETWKQDPNGLNDGFFSIDDFNRQSQFLEQIDTRGDDDNPSDEDDVDWDADPLAQSFSKLKRSDQEEGQESDDPGEEEDDGPTFGDADLNAPDTDDDEDGEQEGYLEDGMPSLNNTNDIRYADFFEPPPKKLSKTKRMRALPKTQPPKAGTSQNADLDLDQDVQRAMNDVNRDIFASESEGEASDSDASGPQSRNLSTHEKQRAKIAAEIRRLEAVSVAKRDWTLSGEARAADRPLNSLIEEDLDFERAGKPVPVVTAETSEEIEQLIKRRIIAREFDEVVRRPPDSIGSAADQRRGRVEVDDSKPQSGLAEIYENEHLKANDPNYVDQRSRATKKQHAQIDTLWKEVSYQLDLLSNLHFKPKRVEADVTVVEDKPRIAMEDARPAGEGVEEQSMLAPQEVYRAGTTKTAGEVIRKSGAAVSKEEMSREEKRRKRNREKERAKKGKVNQGVETVKPGKDGKEKKSKREEKRGILEELKKGGVKVVDKKGELQSLFKKTQDRSAASSSALKL